MTVIPIDENDIALDAAERIGGELTVRGRPGLGARFTLVIQAARAGREPQNDGPL